MFSLYEMKLRICVFLIFRPTHDKYLTSLAYVRRILGFASAFDIVTFERLISVVSGIGERKKRRCSSVLG